MNLQQHFKEQEGKLRLEALLKALLSGFAVGFIVGFIAAALTWFFAITGGVWISIGTTLLVGALATLCFYLKIFKPSVIDNARRLDRLGLDERLITMVEYQNDDSYMAKVQREDAKQQLDKIKSTNIRITIAPIFILGSSLTFLLNGAMTTASGLSSVGLLPSGTEIIESLTPEEPDIYLSVIYDVEEGGYIDGEADQLILKGTDTTPVLAVADDGYIFLEWSDGLTDPYRYDKNIVDELEIIAVFEQVSEDEGDSEGEEEGDPSEEEGEQEKSEDGDPSDEEADSEETQESESEEAKYAEHNQIINGETFYGEVKDEYVESLRQYLEEHRGELTEEEIAIIESYIGIV